MIRGSYPAGAAIRVRIPSCQFYVEETMTINAGDTVVICDPDHPWCGKTGVFGGWEDAGAVWKDLLGRRCGYVTLHDCGGQRAGISSESEMRKVDI